ncbi:MULTISPECIES: apolipoprotein N-acyltransferase [unclassified Leeuwenhoekiella]|uniref:apolipoprotein N-acyltransferase n=1 Tax=unclassified Leeuwenhoekiella TaxID=2615029 RepID=UPI000C3F65CD|nr:MULTISPECIES: apolipoprotein N-acyltransferase [unclassified Leeuwenhoekiella]MAW96683.1 apolipoprotein N-acyltransferase [Leeuwenhoekiella sp.]MBA81572.1 apolipoprotein N-acyltransferase [Leeuwenhoekiella sp.]|tara:strand:+ start:78926 stop:80548 length:1623 start_codon:yes stop_codon:yes gene_type:complete
MKNLLLAFLSGILLALGWPTYGFPALLFFGFIPLLWVTEELLSSTVSKPTLKIFGLAYLAFFIFNIITTWWLYNSTAFGMWFAVLANALLMTFVWLLYVRIRKRFSQNLSLVFLAATWMLYEFMHLNWEFAWPWLNLGNGFANYPGWIQWYEYTGTFGGTLWVWILNGILFTAFFHYAKTRDRKKSVKQVVIAALVILIPIGISQTLFHTYVEEENPVEVVLLQPNIDPYSEKYNTTNERIADLLFSLSDSTITQSTDFVIAPETVLAEGVNLRDFNYSPERSRALEYVSQYPNLNYLAGIQFFRLYDNEKDILPSTNFMGYNRIGNPVYADFFNSAFMLNRSDSTQIYHKSKLVVGVENFPYQNILKPILGDVMIDLGGTVSMKTTQENRGIFKGIEGVTVGPVICYESVFGEFVTGYVQEGAQFLAIITNDAWWGDTQGHKQHLSYARLRAIETRRSIARSANTGISAFIDQKGTITQTLGYKLQGSLKGTINANDKITFYVRYGDYLARLAALLVLIVLVWSFFKKSKKPLTDRGSK